MTTPANELKNELKLQKARELLAQQPNPVIEVMRVLAAAGYYKVKLGGTSPSGVRIVVEGGAPTPKAPAKSTRKGG